MDKGIHQMMQKPFSKYGVHSIIFSLISIEIVFNRLSKVRLLGKNSSDNPQVSSHFGCMANPWKDSDATTC